VNKNVIPDFRNITASMTKVYLMEALPKILSSYPDKLSSYAIEELRKLEVDVILNEKVSEINDHGVKVGDRFIASSNVLWAAGNQASPLIKSLNTEIDKAGRAIVKYDLSIKEDENIFVIGDAAAIKNENGEYLPAIAPVAMQQGRYVAKIIAKNLTGKFRKSFRYSDKGTLATIGKAKAVGVVKGIKLSGLIAWFAWCFIHILYLIGFRNRLRVMVEWIWYYITNRPGIRLIVKYTEDQQIKP
jgi:NADH dehydrogenase